MAEARSGLELHVLGGGEGESIILRCPDGHWGVIDCFNPSTKVEDNPTVNFLVNRGVQELAFACVTHPHSDHYRGMHEVVRKFRPKRFWITLNETVPGILEMLTELENTLVQDLVCAWLFDELNRDFPNFIKLVALLREMHESKQVEIESLVNSMEL